MKALSGITFTSLILTLIIVYLLQPLNAGAVAVVFLITLSFVTLFFKALHLLFKFKSTGNKNVNKK